MESSIVISSSNSSINGIYFGSSESYFRPLNSNFTT